MNRYVAYVWEPNNAHASESTKLLLKRFREQGELYPPILDQPGMLIAISRQDVERRSVVLLGRGLGAIVGTAFSKDATTPNGTPKRITEISVADDDQCRHSKGRSVFEKFWGDFILLLRDDVGNARIYRSPMAQLQCHKMDYGGGTLLFSSVEDILALRLVRFSIHWPVVSAQALQADYITTETGLQGVSTLLCGECATRRKEKWTTQLFWDPRNISATKGMYDDSRFASTELKRAASLAVNAFASEHMRILHLLSGGLDSSIVLSLLSAAPSQPQVECINFYSSGPGDERRYARSMVNRYKTKLREVVRDPAFNFEIFLTCAMTSTPVLHFSAGFSEPVTTQAARETGATAVFDGELGDDIFGRSGGPETLVECIQGGCNARALLRVLIDYSISRKLSVYRTLYLGVREYYRTRHSLEWRLSDPSDCSLRPLESRLATRSALEEYQRCTSSFVHPWLRGIDSVPVGKKNLLGALLLITSPTHQSPFSTSCSPLPISPLASEPVVEVALRTPSFFHLEGALDRAVARHAFGSGLPKEVLNRGNAKGGPTVWARDMIQNNLGLLRDLLLDGLLVREGILDRRRLETILSDSVVKVTPHTGDIFVQLYIESWLRRWSGPDNAVSY